MTPLSWHPDALAARLPHLHRRARLCADTRAFFADRGVLEVETPILQESAGMEPTLTPFRTRYRPLLADPTGGEGGRDLELRFSPEFAIKKLLAGGIGACFELARVFRNGELGMRHTPEFTMLEWYRPGFDLDRLMDETEAYLRHVAPEGLVVDGRRIPTDRPFVRLRMYDAFAEFGVDLAARYDDPEGLADDARRLGLSPSLGDSWQDHFFRILLDRIEPALGRETPVFLTHWPIAEAALARPDPQDPSTALRFELFAGGVELANAYVELTDAGEQRRRFEAWAREARMRDPEPRGWDEAFLAALERGLPECAGIALGFDRLAMLVSGAPSVAAVQFLAFEDLERQPPRHTAPRSAAAARNDVPSGQPEPDRA